MGWALEAPARLHEYWVMGTEENTPIMDANGFIDNARLLRSPPHSFFT